jgi:hypothetical protein
VSLPTSLPHVAYAPARNLALGESGDVSLTPQCKNNAGRWVAPPRPPKATRWKARVYVRRHDGVPQEIVRFGRTRREAEASPGRGDSSRPSGSRCCHQPDHATTRGGSARLQQIARPDSGLSARTIADYCWTWQRYVDLRRRRSAVSHSSKRMTGNAYAASCNGWPRHTAPRRRRRRWKKRADPCMRTGSR